MKKHLLSVAVCLAGSLILVGCGSSSSSSSDATATQKTTRGVIDGFGSVIVNGVHYNTDKSQINVDRRDGTQADLRVGQVVTIVGSHNGSIGVADTIVYSVNVEGTVTETDAAAGTLVVLGQTISTNSLTMYDGVTLDTVQGKRVEVSGYDLGSGKMMASFIGLDDDTDEEDELTGTVSALDTAAKTFKIGALVIDYSNAKLDLDGKALANDLLVEVEGKVVDGTLIASEVELEDSDFDINDDVEIEGYISLVNAEEKSFILNGMTVRYNDKTEFDDGSVTDLVEGAFVEVEGAIVDDGSLLAEEIEFDEGIEIELEAKVEGIDLDAKTLTVMGITISTDLRTRVRDSRDKDQFFNLSKLNVGDNVELLLEETSAGKYRAQLLKRVEADDEVSIEAPVTAIDKDAGTITVLGLVLTVPPAYSSLLEDLEIGHEVEIEGTYNGGVLMITEIEID